MHGMNKLVELLTNCKSASIEMWVCDYNSIEYKQKLIRDLLPTHVQIGRTYDGQLFILNLDDNAEKNVYIQFYVDGSYSNRRDLGLNFFHSKDDCICEYNKLIYESVISLKEYKIKMIKDIDKFIEVTNEKFIGTDIVMETLINN